MTTPVPVPVGPLVLSEQDLARVRLFVAAMAQVMREGTSGTSEVIDPTLIPVPNTEDQYAVVDLSTPQQQLFYMQLGAALASVFAGGAGGIGLGEVSITPAPNKIPRALSSGRLDAGWIPAIGGEVEEDVACDLDVAVGDFVFIQDGVAKKSNCNDPLTLPSAGVIVYKTNPNQARMKVVGKVPLYSGLVQGRVYWVGPASRPVHPPAADSYWQIGGVAINATTLVVAPHLQVLKG